MGRPEIYTIELGAKICEEIANSSKGLKSICDSNPSFPSYRTVFNWLNDDTKKEFLQSYTCARDAQAELLADEIIEIADDSSLDHITVHQGADMPDITVENREFVNRSKIKIDARKWKASKLAPKKFGDKLDVTSDNKALIPMALKIEIVKPSEE